MFHALTGCDTVSSFVGHSKKTAWSTWNALPDLTDALLTLSSAPSFIEDVIHIIARFVILMYDRTSTCHNINKARRKFFSKKNVKNIPPTKASHEQHIIRATYQGGHVCGLLLLPSPLLPLPTGWSWIKTTEGIFEPNWTTLPETSKVCYELISCKCKKGYAGCCKCKKAALKSTGLCMCEGECTQN